MFKNFIALAKQTIKGKLAGQAIWSILIKIVYTIITPLTVVLLARILGPEHFGIYAFTISVMTLLSVPTKLGFPMVIIRYASNYFHNKDYNKLKGLFSFTNAIVFIISLLIISTSLILIINDYFSLETENRLALIYGIPLILILGLEGLRSASLKGIDEVVVGQIPEMIIRPLIFLILIVSINYIFTDLTYKNSIVIYVLSALIAYLVGAWILVKKLPKGFKSIKSTFERKRWIKTAIPLLILGSVQVVGGQIDIILLGLYQSNTEVGVYKAIYQTAILVTFGLSAINTVIAPKLSKYFEQNDRARVSRMIKIGNLSIFILGLPIGLILAIFGKEVLGLVFGSEYIIGYTGLFILVMGRIINALFGTSTIALKMSGYEKIAAYGIIIGTLVNIALNVLLIPHYGIIGAAIASSCGLITWNFILFYQTSKKLILKN